MIPPVSPIASIPPLSPVHDVTYSSAQVINQNKICKGYSPVLIGDVYNNFPYQLICEIPSAVFENRVLHSTDCMEKCYMLFNVKTSEDVNVCCYNLQFSKPIDMIERANKPWSNEMHTMKNKYLTHKQLTTKVKKHSSRKA